MIVGMIAGKKVFWNCSMGVITSRVEYMSSVFNATVFGGTRQIAVEMFLKYEYVENGHC